MSADKTLFVSCLNELISGYIAEKRAVGYKFTKGASLLKQLDKFLSTEWKLTDKKLPKEVVLQWTKKKPNEKESTRIHRISIIRGLAEYMSRMGYVSYIYPKSAIRINRYDYIPYIFSKDELKRIFYICDNYPISVFFPNRHLVLPLLFRMLYGCGLRISEAVNLKLNDINLESGTLYIKETKFDKERIIPMAETLTERCRDLTLMVTLYDTGARVQELIDLKVCDIRLSQPATILLKGKGNKNRSVPIMDKTSKLIKNYMIEHHLVENGKQSHPLFYNSKNNPLTRPGVSYILEKYLKKAKETHPEILFPRSINPHMMRHTKAMHLLESGVNLVYIRDLLGHVSVITTEHYARVNSEAKRKALESTYTEVVLQDIPHWEEDTNLLQWLNDFCR